MALSFRAIFIRTPKKVFYSSMVASWEEFQIEYVGTGGIFYILSGILVCFIQNFLKWFMCKI
jgi:hypothetical protein